MDIGATVIQFPCPVCEFINSTSFTDVASGASLICVGCLRTINLVDGENSTKRAVSDINTAFNHLRGSLNGN